MSEYSNYWVFVEALNGKAKNVGLEVIGPSKTMAAAAGEKVVAVLIGSGLDEAAAAAISYGADQVIKVDSADYADFSVEGYTYALQQLVEKYKPAALLLGATSNGRELAPRLAARLKTGVASDCTGLELVDGAIRFTRPVYSGRMLSVLECSDRKSTRLNSSH